VPCPAGIPFFWKDALTAHPKLMSYFTDGDLEVLEYLVDVSRYVESVDVFAYAESVNVLSSCIQLHAVLEYLVDASVAGGVDVLS
jgi:hypothetical protein